MRLGKKSKKLFGSGPKTNLVFCLKHFYIFTKMVSSRWDLTKVYFYFFMTEMSLIFFMSKTDMERGKHRFHLKTTNLLFSKLVKVFAYNNIRKIIR